MFLQIPVVAFICAALVLIPLPWHWRAGNVSTIAISAWLFVGSIIDGVGSIIWGNTVENIAPIWCDISTKLQIGSTVALPAAMFCLCIQLERISSVRQVSVTHSDKRCRQILDGILCFGVPVVYMALHYVVQGHRFDIVEGFGCRPAVYESIASIFLMWLPPLLFAIGGCVYAGLAFAHFWRRRATFARHLQNSNSTLTTGRYLRLMCMSIVEMFIGILVTSIDMWFSLRGGLRPWISWDNVHSNFSEVAYFPLVLLPKSTLLWVFVIWAEIPVASILFFAFFAFGREAMKEYFATFSWIRRNIFLTPDRPSKHSLSSVSGSFGNAVCRKPEKPCLDIHVSNVHEVYPPYSPHSAVSFGTVYTPSTIPYRTSKVDDNQEPFAPSYANSSRTSRSSLEKGEDYSSECDNSYNSV
ncbi:hypothetical protein PAXRUDRAFT_834509 [Paxillus rubicundulus Ve08.2h10]|uniref:Uncharacterized protein n=1 Tax=Paxillus rubicundulus Ve08.2h10 TaxID=930991 RepID=A0A0D0D4L4_9AGAM|nr:hypothetical protein PAXRUDRAFT_834509 [Paxillus rubicundulus Ve08.2h10]